jgi:hypothetical protein
MPEIELRALPALSSSYFWQPFLPAISAISRSHISKPFLSAISGISGSHVWQLFLPAIPASYCFHVFLGKTSCLISSCEVYQPILAAISGSHV